jgi:hypothetical protein
MGLSLAVTRKRKMVAVIVGQHKKKYNIKIRKLGVDLLVWFGLVLYVEKSGGGRE